MRVWLLALVLVTACQNQSKSSHRSVSEQEGIGGDLAAFYAKSVTASSLRASLDKTPEDYEPLETALADTPVYSDSSLPDLVVRKGNALWVDRERIGKAHPCMIASKYLIALHGEVSEFDKAACLSIEIHWERAQKRNWSLKGLLSKLKASEHLRPTTNRQLRSGPKWAHARSSIAAMGEAYENVRFEYSSLPVYDIANSKRVDVITRWDEYGESIIRIDEKRIDEIPELYALLPVFFLHELNHASQKQQLPDRKYALTQEIFSMWLRLN